MPLLTLPQCHPHAYLSSPINMVTDLGSGIAGFMKTPSEEGGRFPFPPATPGATGDAPYAPGHPTLSSTLSGGGSVGSLVNSFSPVNIMNSVG